MSQLDLLTLVSAVLDLILVAWYFLSPTKEDEKDEQIVTVSTIFWAALLVVLPLLFTLAKFIQFLSTIYK